MDMVAGRLHFADGQALQRLLDGGGSGLTLRLEPGAARALCTSCLQGDPVYFQQVLVLPLRAHPSNGLGKYRLQNMLLINTSNVGSCPTFEQAAQSRLTRYNAFG